MKNIFRRLFPRRLFRATYAIAEFIISSVIDAPDLRRARLEAEEFVSDGSGWLLDLVEIR